MLTARRTLPDRQFRRSGRNLRNLDGGPENLEPRRLEAVLPVLSVFGAAERIGLVEVLARARRVSQLPKFFAVGLRPPAVVAGLRVFRQAAFLSVDCGQQDQDLPRRAALAGWFGDLLKFRHRHVIKDRVLGVFAQGRYQITKQKKDGFYFLLQSRELNAEYRIYNTKGKDWLLERLDTPQVDWLADPIEPMLATLTKDIPGASDDYLYEVKWDGIRALVSLDDGEITIRSRSQRDITHLFPELAIPDQAFRASGALFDTEIVCLEDDGQPNFRKVINRIQQSTEGGVKRARASKPAVCYVFDCLYLDGRSIAGEPLVRRREWMIDALRKGTPYRVSEGVDEGAQLFEAARRMGLEGVMAKRRESTYAPGKRSAQWLKIKTRRTLDCLIIGYTKGKGTRDATFGALHIARREGAVLTYLGKVGTGFDDRLLKNILTELKKVKQAKRPVKEKPPDDAQTVWLEPKLLCEVQYASFTGAGALREPVFLRLRPDLME